MKNIFILIISFISIFILLTAAASYCYVSGNTFTIPSDNKENNSYHTYKIDKNTENNQNKKSNNIPKNNKQNTNTNNNIKSKHYYTKNNSPGNGNKPGKNYTNNNSSPNKKNNNKTREKTSRKRTFKKHNINIITKIEFQKHFIKIKEGSSENILLRTTPAKASHTGFIYKSNNNSIAVYKNNKLTGINKGFTTILIILQDGTVKAACPVKVI